MCFNMQGYVPPSACASRQPEGQVSESTMTGSHARPHKEHAEKEFRIRCLAAIPRIEYQRKTVKKDSAVVCLSGPHDMRADAAPMKMYQIEEIWELLLSKVEAVLVQ